MHPAGEKERNLPCRQPMRTAALVPMCWNICRMNCVLNWNRTVSFMISACTGRTCCFIIMLDRDAALAYALGFVCHFALDSTCHPYVEQFTRESGVTHCEIETEFDNMLLRRDGHDPLKFFTASHIHPSEKNAGIIAPFYEGISEQTALEALKGMISVHRLLQASNPVKRWVVLTGMKVVGKYDMLHGLVANPQPNPKCVKSGKQLEALYAKALPLAETLILEFMAKLDTDEPLDKAYDHTFGEF